MSADEAEGRGNAEERAGEMPVEAADGGIGEPGNGQPEPEVTGATETGGQGDGPTEALAEALGVALDPVRQEVRAATEAAERAEAAATKTLDLYTLMTEQRNRATLLLTKHVEMYERIKGLADLCRQTFADDGTLAPGPKSILARSRNMAKIAKRTLASFGAVPVWPNRGDVFDETMHRIVAEIPPGDAGDAPGTIAECLKMGLVRDGIVAAAAEVVVFGAEQAPQPQPTQPQPN